MIRQYNPQRYRPMTLRAGDLVKDVKVGTIDVGDIIYIQANLNHPTFREPWMVMGWHNRVYCAHHKEHGKYVDSFMLGGHLAQVKSLRTGLTRDVSDHILTASANI